jgi:hypothetical protein
MDWTTDTHTHTHIQSFSQITYLFIPKTPVFLGHFDLSKTSRYAKSPDGELIDCTFLVFDKLSLPEDIREAVGVNIRILILQFSCWKKYYWHILCVFPNSSLIPLNCNF